MGETDFGCVKHKGTFKADMSVCVIARRVMCVCVYACMSACGELGDREMQIQALTCEMFTQA